MIRYKKYIILALLLLAGILCFHGKLLQRFSPQISQWLSLTNLSHQHDTASLANLPHLVEKYGPAVVAIRVSQYEPNSLNRLLNREQNGSSDNDPLLEFFDHFAPVKPESENHAIAYGSGFIIDSAGYILTSAHLIKEASSIKVILRDKREFIAQLMGRDESSDVALLKIASADLPTVKIGNPSELKVGQWVFAIGSPFGFEHSVTTGIVSAKGRSLPTSSLPFIQTDVAINLGNSGGPLFNLHGEVIGINAQIYSRSGEFIGLSFAIPIDLALHTAHQLQQTGRAQHGQLGIYVQTVTQALATAFKLDRPRGILVKKLEPKHAANRAGIQVGDIILSLNNQPIEEDGDLLMLMSKMLPQQKITLTLWRYGQEKSIQVVLDKGPSTSQPLHLAKKKSLSDLKPKQRLEALGLLLSPLNDWQKKQLHLDKGGLLIHQVKNMAAEAGLMRGDIIIGLNHHPINTIHQLQQALGKATRDVALLIERGNTVLFIPLLFH